MRPAAAATVCDRVCERSWPDNLICISIISWQRIAPDRTQFHAQPVFTSAASMHTLRAGPLLRVHSSSTRSGASTPTSLSGRRPRLLQHPRLEHARPGARNLLAAYTTPPRSIWGLSWRRSSGSSRIASSSASSARRSGSDASARAGNPPFWAVERPARPYKSSVRFVFVQNRFT